MRTVTTAALSILIPFTVLHCGGDAGNGDTTTNTATIEGSIEEGGGAQAQRDLGGSGSIAASTDIKVSTIAADGTLTTVASGKVAAGGTFAIKVPPSKKNLVIQATDVSGTVQVAAIIEKSGAKDSTTKIAPLTTESSVEADVLVQLYAMGVSEADANSIDLRTRINANVAAAVKVSTKKAAIIKALAEATATAQRAQAKAYASAGTALSQEALFDLQLNAAVTLNAALNAKQDADDAYTAFHAALDAALKAKGLDEEKRAHAEARAEITFRTALKARINDAADSVYDASVRASTTLQARTEAAAVQAALTASGASQAALDAAIAANAALRTELAASASANASAAAYVAYHNKLVGSASVEGSVWDLFADINVANQITVDAAVAATVAAQSALNAALEASVSISGALDIEASAQAAVVAYTAFENAIKAQQAALELAFPGKGNASISLLVYTHASYRTN